MAAHDGKIGCNTIENTAAYLYPDWLYFLWHGINRAILKVQSLLIFSACFPRRSDRYFSMCINS